MRGSLLLHSTPPPLLPCSAAYSKRITDEMFYLMESIPALSVLSEEQRRRLAEAMEPMEFEDGDVIFRKGDPGDRFFLVKEGHVRILVDGKLVSKVSPGQVGASSPF